MSSNLQIIPSLSPYLFWDIDFTNLDFNKNKRLIVERVFTMGNKAEIRDIIKYYGLPIIKKEIIRAGNLDSKSLNWISFFLNIPKSKFKCYTRKRSNKMSWTS